MRHPRRRAHIRAGVGTRTINDSARRHPRRRAHSRPASAQARRINPRRHPGRRAHIRPGVGASTSTRPRCQPRRRAHHRPVVDTSTINHPTPTPPQAHTHPPGRRHEDGNRLRPTIHGWHIRVDVGAARRRRIAVLDRGAPAGRHAPRRAEMPGLAEYRTDPGGARNDAFTLATAPRAARPRSARRAIQALSGVGRVGPPEVRRRAGCASGAGVVSRVPASRRARPSESRRRGGRPRWPPPRCSRRSRWRAGSR